MIPDRLRDTVALVRDAVDRSQREGLGNTGRSVVARLAGAVGQPGDSLDIAMADIADPGPIGVPRPRPVALGTPLRIAWVITPPSLGSGGHTTLFRMVAAAEAAGHECVLILYDRFHGSPERREAVIRRGWPSLRARVVDGDREWPPADVVVATSWQTAHVLKKRLTFPAHCFYFVQDYEPYFYAHGPNYTLAAASYDFGFAHIAVGRMVARALEGHHRVSAAVAEFGCDGDVYRRTCLDRRSGVVFYARPGVARRGYPIAVAALTELHLLAPEVPIHVVGADGVNLPFPSRRHGTVTPRRMAEIYNECAAGLALSYTNISLVAEEMLACGVVPLVNDDPGPRLDLNNPHVLWSPSVPALMAVGLQAVVTDAGQIQRSADAAASVRGEGWRPAAEATVSAIERIGYSR